MQKLGEEIDFRALRFTLPPRDPEAGKVDFLEKTSGQFYVRVRAPSYGTPPGRGGAAGACLITKRFIVQEENAASRARVYTALAKSAKQSWKKKYYFHLGGTYYKLQIIRQVYYGHKLR